MRLRLSRILLIALVISIVMPSCSLFRKKNKCMSCPTWDDEIRVEQVEVEHEDDI